MWIVRAIAVITVFISSSTAMGQYKESVEPSDKDPVVTNMQAEGSCDRVDIGTFVGVFSWDTTAPVDARQRIDVTMFRGGFEYDAFETIGDLSAQQSRLEWSGGRPGTNYSWRVGTWLKDGWISSPIRRFQPHVCPVDSFEEPPQVPAAPRG